MQEQRSIRMALLNDLIAQGVISTPIEYLETPAFLVLNMSDTDLVHRYKQLMLTRKINITFGLNGRMYVLPRKVAIALVTNEINARKLVIRNQRKKEKNERHKNT